MSEQKYVIAWRSKKTGAEGAGTGLFDKEEAENYASQLNRQDARYGIEHWVKLANSPESESEKTNV